MARNDKDINEKLLIDYNDVFSDIVNFFLFDGQQIVLSQDLETALPVSSYKADGNLHMQERDASKYWKKGGVFLSLIGLENQSEEDKYMPFRIIGYDGAAYRMQVLKESTRFPVITLVLYYGSRHWKGSLHLKDHLQIPEELKDYVNDYRINVFEISFLREEEINQFQSDFQYVADYFAKIRTDPTYKGSDGELKHVDAVMKLISAVSGRPYDEPAKKEVKEGRDQDNEECNQ